MDWIINLIQYDLGPSQPAQPMCPPINGGPPHPVCPPWNCGRVMAIYG